MKHVGALKGWRYNEYALLIDISVSATLEDNESIVLCCKGTAARNFDEHADYGEERSPQYGSMTRHWTIVVA